MTVQAPGTDSLIRTDADTGMDAQPPIVAPGAVLAAVVVCVAIVGVPLVGVVVWLAR